MKKRVCVVAFIVVIMLVISMNHSRKQPVSKTDFKLNTVVTITLYDGDEEILDACMALCDSYEKIFSRTDKTSELYQLNHGLLEKDADGYMEVSKELYQLIADGLFYMEQTDERFHIGMEPLTSLWDFSSEEKKIPSKQEIDRALVDINEGKILCKSPNLICLEDGARIDLGATAKGYISKKIADYLVEQGIESAVISLGGNIVCIGSKPGNVPYVIGIQEPFATRGTAIGTVRVQNMAIVSSGIYERYFESQGTLYHHILNPHTGYPYENDIVGVTILCEDAYLADLYSTVCLTLGSEDALQFLSSEETVEGIIIKKDGTTLYSDGFIEKYQYQEK